VIRICNRYRKPIGTLLMVGFLFLPAHGQLPDTKFRIPLHWPRKSALPAQVHKGGENKKLTTVVLGLTLGAFGVHRLYLGTKDYIPVVYAVTLGGAYILVLVDVVMVVTHQDISPYVNNPHVFMWANPAQATDSIPSVRNNN
jgi:hypothetical protein